jgi:DNA-binding Lrp family transcriptional regulator
VPVKAVEFKLISELMKNSRRSDRELAKAVGVSQPTISRLIRKLEKEGLIKEYTMLPDFNKLGYELFAISFIKFGRMLSPKEVEKAKNEVSSSFKNAPMEIVLIERGTGLGYHGVFTSFHKNYTAYVEFREWLRRLISVDLSDVQSFIISLADEVRYRPLTFTTLAKHILTLSEDNNK